jgi:hypothetical protein|tara:strand:+ start:844 stop:1014 length:171 start_codon:yes stop_codon:yes gene_type:complete
MKLYNWGILTLPIALIFWAIVAALRSESDKSSLLLFLIIFFGGAYIWYKYQEDKKK